MIDTGAAGPDEDREMAQKVSGGAGLWRTRHLQRRGHEAFVHPIEVARQSGHQRGGNDFRTLVGMQFTQAAFQIGVARLAGLDREQSLLRLFDGALPAIGRDHRGDAVDAGGQAIGGGAAGAGNVAGGSVASGAGGGAAATGGQAIGGGASGASNTAGGSVAAGSKDGEGAAMGQAQHGLVPGEDGAQAEGGSATRAAIVSAARSKLGKIFSNASGGVDETGEKTRAGWEDLWEIFSVAVPGFPQQIVKYLKYGKNSDASNPNGLPSWCGIFATWAVMTAGGNSDHWRSGNRVDNLKKLTNDPRPGDVGNFVKNNHYCIIAAVNGDSIETIDGNSFDGASGGDGAVATKTRSRGEFRAFFRQVDD